jgi:PAS domain S-box-containing protein
MGDGLSVLCVDDDPELGTTLSASLEHHLDRVEVESVESASAALARVRAEDIDCVVSDYRMPEMDGLDLLDAIREEYPDLPVILFTGTGSEELASDAIARGVTDYLQKKGTGEQFAVLANRIENAVESYRTKQTLAAERERYSAFLEQSTDLLAVVDERGVFSYLSKAWERLMGYEPHELEGQSAFDRIHDDDTGEVIAEFKAALENPTEIRTVTCRAEHGDGSYRWLEVIGNNQLANPAIEGFVINARDITERKARERELRDQNERLEQFTGVVSHDLRNPLNIAQGRLELARETGAEEHFDATADAHDRMDAMIEDLLETARGGQAVVDTERVALADVAERTADAVVADGVDITVETDAEIVAERARLKRVFENLLRNAVEHAGPAPSIRVGRVDDGFFVADDGPGIPEAEREQVFESGYTTTSDGNGLGLSIVASIAEAHGWEVAVVDGASGGTRFEFSEVEIAARSAETVCEVR